ncbi:DUF5058 family protein [Faecalibacterium sp. CLA-AA-H281]|uniref:DUF5058 family protein n=1 Tax=Faecalibacterium intestinale TaxID=3133155 RepID=A0ABV1C2J0_9FIRM
MLADRNTLAKRIPPRMLPVLGDILGGLLYISAFSLVYLKKAYDHCLELGITRKELSNVIKSSLIFPLCPAFPSWWACSCSLRCWAACGLGGGCRSSARSRMKP